MVSYKELGLVNTRDMFSRAINSGYAIPAFNFNNMEQLQAIIKAAPKPTACLAHSLLLMPNLEAQIMLGILPGMSIPPEIIKLISKNVSVRVLISGVTSIAAKVALSNTAERELIQ